MKTANALSERIRNGNLQATEPTQPVKNDTLALEIRVHEAFILPKEDEIWGVPTCCLDFNNFQAI